jgi:predicted acylesterase/phospholipase RssA
MIEHISLSSAGPNGLIQLGILSHIIDSNLLDPIKLKSIHASSAGSIVGLFLCLQIPIQDIIDYFIQRPLDKWFKIDMSQFMTHKGLVSSDCFHQLLLPFFNAYDIPSTLTMNELYTRTNIDFHIFTTSVTEMKSVDINHNTFPDLSVLTAVSMSSCIPFLFTPIYYENEYYIDGGVMRHCPVPEMDPEKILIILIDFKQELDLSCTLQYIQHIFMKSFDIISSNTTLPTCKYLFRYNVETISINPIVFERTLKDKNYRIELIEIGKKHAIDFIEKIEI